MKDGWSLRSQKSRREEEQLRKKLQLAEGNVALCKKKLAKAQESVESMTPRAATPGNTGAATYLADAVAEVERLKPELANHERFAASLRSKIEALVRVSPAEAVARRKRQDSAARCAQRCRVLDGEIAAALETVGGLLKKRDHLTDRLKAICADLDFTLRVDTLDESRVDALAAALPSDVEAQSEAWMARFLGRKRPEARAYKVTGVSLLILPETLASNGVHAYGDIVHLTDAEAAKWLATTEERRIPAIELVESPVSSKEGKDAEVQSPETHRARQRALSASG